ncbi:37S ribosomal protein Mrp17 [Drechmeria coniospora]|uniref:37S ribosomal protein Mrp17 n=1 Tax=Drechmeria coniospora TaxID=98403 RepID=A0A151GHV0_DRECN|nr:37S ribosomal protein Mrp17 [Drechmeria coniospora]KYK56612.1 37S ribosomal protein Mrp17 [Drechmeria coniospora]ODA77051.1 hypothetical protein RJ55_07569 [Drechmeria coniospora]
MLYELIAIVRPGNLTEVKEYVHHQFHQFHVLPDTPQTALGIQDTHADPYLIRIAQTVGSLVLKNGGVVRGLSNWGVFSLPKPVSVHQMKHTHGHYFAMRYDASTKVHSELRSTLRLEPRMIRAAHVKLGDGKLETLSRFGAPKWRTQGSEA